MELKIKVAQLKLKVQSLMKVDDSTIENELYLMKNKFTQANHYYTINLKVKYALIDDLRKELVVRNMTIGNKDEELNRVNRDYRSYKRVVDKDGRLSDTLFLLNDKIIEGNRSVNQQISVRKIIKERSGK